MTAEFKRLVVSRGAINDFYEEMKDSDVFVIHIGVYTELKTLNIEKFGANIADFTVPDAAGDSPQCEPITPNLPIYARVENKIDVDKLVENPALQGMYEVSCDAGTYICNYTYFVGLRAVGDVTKGCMFVHIPTFEAVPLEEQADRVVALVDIISKYSPSEISGEK